MYNPFFTLYNPNFTHYENVKFFREFFTFYHLLDREVISMRKENQLHAITHITPEQATGYTQINDNQWSVYFYLLSNSDYNSIDKEDHRFIYRSDINITRLSEKLNFTRQTYYNILKALHKRKLIDNNNSDYILLPLPKLYAEISKELMG